MTVAAPPAAAADGRHPYVVAFYQPPAQTAVGVPTALGIAVINPTGASVTFAFTATLPPHMRVADLGREIAQSPCVTASSAPAGGSTVAAAGTAQPTLGLEGCGVIVPIVVDAPGTYPATGISLSHATNVPSQITDVGAIGNCEPCALLETSLTVTPPLTAQTITFGPFGAVSLSAATTALSGSATSGLPLTYITRSPAICTVRGDTVSLLAPGTCTVTALQQGDLTTYAPAQPVTTSFAVVPPA
ncbi:hypothetical protein ACQP00_24830 [Dactylosporangium sp. CS-047395]|uniref:hypothetical protein n=1 Tax=Dactylosporangium sp. CS-047395 TaxID=3239936 RepID=UPI003D9231B2